MPPLPWDEEIVTLNLASKSIQFTARSMLSLRLWLAVRPSVRPNKKAPYRRRRRRPTPASERASISQRNVFARRSIDQSRSTTTTLVRRSFGRSLPDDATVRSFVGWVGSGIRVVIIARRPTTTTSQSRFDMMNSRKKMSGARATARGERSPRFSRGTQS